MSPDVPDHLLHLFPHATEDLWRLFAAAEENAALLRCDLTTIRDWLEITDYQQESMHALLLLLILALEEGSLCIEISQENLSRRFGELVPGEQAREWAARLIADLNGNDFDKLVGTTSEDNRPIIRYEADGRCFFYFQKFLRHDLEFSRAFRAKLASPGPAIPPEKRQALMSAVLDDQPLRPGGQPLILDADQQRALELALSRSLVLISGGPGTGKTSIVLSLLRCLVRSGLAVDHIALAAPTGRAAQRLADAIRMGLTSLPLEANTDDAPLHGLGATTLHQLLEYVPSRDQFRRHAENPLEAEVVIVDEVSMVGMTLMAHLFQALRPQARLILLGDKDQLPSVDAGAVLATVIPGPSCHGPEAQAVRDALVILRTNHRSEPEIRGIADALNRQETDVLDRLPALEIPSVSETTWALAEARGVRFLEQKEQSADEIRRALKAWAEYAYVSSGYQKKLAQCMAFAEEDNSPSRQECLRELFRLLDHKRLLTLIREGPWGCVAINQYLDHTLRPRLDRAGREILFAGAPVLITRNDPVRELFNGDVGITLRNPKGDLRVVFPRQGSFLSFPAAALPAHELGFALTVHKSQGSEYGQVFLVFPPTGGRRLLTKELFYTGVTRAKELVILSGTREVLQMTIQKKCKRESGVMRFQEGD